MNLALLYELHARRVIPFPEKLWKSGGSCYPANELCLGLTAAAMLFPSENDRGNFVGYAANELNRIIAHVDTMPDDIKNDFFKEILPDIVVTAHGVSPRDV